MPLLLQLRDDVEQSPGILAAKAARRLIHDQHACACRERPRDLHHLLTGDRE